MPQNRVMNWRRLIAPLRSRGCTHYHTVALGVMAHGLCPQHLSKLALRQRNSGALECQKRQPMGLPLHCEIGHRPSDSTNFRLT